MQTYVTVVEAATLIIVLIELVTGFVIVTVCVLVGRLRQLQALEKSPVRRAPTELSSEGRVLEVDSALLALPHTSVVLMVVMVVMLT